jgi:hypothetical protein
LRANGAFAHLFWLDLFDRVLGQYIALRVAALDGEFGKIVVKNLDPRRAGGTSG